MFYRQFQYPRSAVYLCADLCSLFHVCLFNKVYKVGVFGIGCSNVATKEEILSVGSSQPEIIGLPVMLQYSDDFYYSWSLNKV